MRRYRTIGWSGVSAALLVMAAGCSDNGQTNPPPETALQKPSKSGDNQIAAPNTELGQPLRVLVTRDGDPAAQVTVNWTTPSGGELGAATSLSDDNGIAQMTWTLGPVPGPQTARASVVGATNSPLVYNATAEEGGGPPPEPVVVQVEGPPVDQFSPSIVHVQQGGSVTWVWAAGATGHNVTPDASIPAAESGTALFDAPHSYTYTFTKAGTYRYYCFAHGGAGGTGMSGVVIVDPPL
jgi:plastocyanin